MCVGVCSGAFLLERDRAYLCCVSRARSWAFLYACTMRGCGVLCVCALCAVCVVCRVCGVGALCVRCVVACVCVCLFGLGSESECLRARVLRLRVCAFVRVCLFVGVRASVYP